MGNDRRMGKRIGGIGGEGEVVRNGTLKEQMQSSRREIAEMGREKLKERNT